MEKIQQALHNYGLSENQIQVYLVILKLHSVPASTIARHTSIKRVTVYTVLDSLIKRGLVSEYLSGESKYFSATHPELFVQEQEKQLQQLQATLPDLVAMIGNYNNKPHVQYFEGVQGIIRLYDDMLDSKESIHAFLGVSPTMNQGLQAYLNDVFLPARVAQSLGAKVILSQHENNNIYKPYTAGVNVDHTTLTEILVVDNPTFQLANEINLYGPNKVSLVLFNHGELSGFIIQSMTLYQSLSSIFDLVWSMGKSNAK